MKKIKKIIDAFIRYAFGYDTEYTKREMSLLTRVVAFFVISFIGIVILSYYMYVKFNVSYKIINCILSNYAKIAVPCVSGYFVSWIAQMGKAFMAKQQYESNRTKLKMKKLDNGIIEEEMENEDN